MDVLDDITELTSHTDAVIDESVRFDFAIWLNVFYNRPEDEPEITREARECLDFFLRDNPFIVSYEIDESLTHLSSTMHHISFSFNHRLSSFRNVVRFLNSLVLYAGKKNFFVDSEPDYSFIVEVHIMRLHVPPRSAGSGTELYNATNLCFPTRFRYPDLADNKDNFYIDPFFYNYQRAAIILLSNLNVRARFDRATFFTEKFDTVHELLYKYVQDIFLHVKSFNAGKNLKIIYDTTRSFTGRPISKEAFDKMIQTDPGSAFVQLENSGDFKRIYNFEKTLELIAEDYLICAQGVCYARVELPSDLGLRKTELLSNLIVYLGVFPLNYINFEYSARILINDVSTARDIDEFRKNVIGKLGDLFEFPNPEDTFFSRRIIEDASDFGFPD